MVEAKAPRKQVAATRRKSNGSRAEVDWVGARLAWVNSMKTHKQIAEEFGSTPAAVSMRSMHEKWSEARNYELRKVSEASQLEITKQRIDELSQFDASCLKVAKALLGQVVSHLNNSQQRNRPIPPIELRSLAGSADTAQKMGRLAMGVSTDNTSPTAPKTPKELADKIREEMIAAEPEAYLNE